MDAAWFDLSALPANLSPATEKDTVKTQNAVPFEDRDHSMSDGRVSESESELEGDDHGYKGKKEVRMGEGR